VKGVMSDTGMPGFGVVVEVDNGRFKYPDLPAAVENIFVDLNIISPGGPDLDNMVVDLKRFALTLAGNPVEARMHLATPMSDPNVDAELRADLDLASVKKVVPMKEELKGHFSSDVRMKGRMSDVDAGRYDQFQADGTMVLRDMDYRSDSLPPMAITKLHFAFSPRFLQLGEFDGSIGSSRIKAQGRMDNYLQWWLKDSTLVGSFDLTANRFDLNELMGPVDTTAATTTPADTTPMSVIEVPGNIDFRMGMAVGEVIYDKLQLTNVKGGLHVHDQRVDLKDVLFNLFSGTVTMAGAYDTKDAKRPRIDMNYDVREIDIEQSVAYMDLIQKMAPIAKSCKGRFSTDLTMQAVLNDRMEPDMNTLQGRGTFSTRSVRVDGFQPLVDIAKALKLKGIENTTVQDINFVYRIVDGRMITDPFPVKIDRVKATVGGSTAFADHAIDYDMKAKVPGDMFGQGASQTIAGLLGKANEAIGSNFAVPAELDVQVKITGTLEKPIVKPMFAGGRTSVKEAATEAIKQELNQQIGKAKEEAIARAREEAARLVAEARQQADKVKADARREAAAAKAQAYKLADDELARITNPLAKMAAKAVADKARKEADRKEQQFVAEADKRADDLVEIARRKGDELIAKAEATNTTVK
jgi:hypothetical protein